MMHAVIFGSVQFDYCLVVNDEFHCTLCCEIQVLPACNIMHAFSLDAAVL